MKIDYIKDESFEPDGSNGDQTDSEQDSENDYKENSQTKKAKSSKTTDVKRFSFNLIWICKITDWCVNFFHQKNGLHNLG